MKLRPVLLLTNTVGPGSESIVVYISSVIPDTFLASDLLLDPAQSQHKSSGLRTASVLRLHKMATLHQTSLQRRLGVPLPVTMAQVDEKLRVVFTL